MDKEGGKHMKKTSINDYTTVKCAERKWMNIGIGI